MKKVILSMMAFMVVTLMLTNKNQVEAVCLPPGGSIEGIYKTDFAEMTLHLNGNRVTGTYKYKGGKIDGILNGHTLSGTWVQENSRGRMVFVFADDFSSFTGKWGYNENTPSSKWNGTQITSFGSSGSSIQPSSWTPSTYSSNSQIEGIYTTDFKEMTLSISGNHVTGTYKHMGGKIDGTLQGNRLIGTWKQTNGRGKLDFVFNSDFSSFTGKWSYNDSNPSSKWNGTKIGSSVNTTSVQTSLPVDIAGSWYGSADQRGRLNFWQNGDEFSVIMCWADQAGNWKTYKGDGQFEGRLMRFKVFPTSAAGKSVDQGYVYYLTVSPGNNEIIGYYTRNGKKMDRENFYYYRVK